MDWNSKSALVTDFGLKHAELECLLGGDSRLTVAEISGCRCASLCCSGG
jgi:hypothetical protein